MKQQVNPALAAAGRALGLILLNMRTLFLILIISLIDNYTFCQTDADHSTSITLRSFFAEIARIDSLTNTGELENVHGDGDWGSSTEYYLKNSIIKSSSTEYYNDGLFIEEEYPNLTHGNFLRILSFIKNGIMKFEMYLIRINSNEIEILIQGNREEFVDKIEKLKK